MKLVSWEISLVLLEIVDDDNCECSSQGTRFLVHGRAKQSEIRGCSDT